MVKLKPSKVGPKVKKAGAKAAGKPKAAPARYIKPPGKFTGDYAPRGRLGYKPASMGRTGRLAAVPRSEWHRFGATYFGTPTYDQKMRDALAEGHGWKNITAARQQAIAEVFAERCEAAVEREVAARAAGEITKADKDDAKKLEPMFQALKEGGGYKPKFSSKPGSETRWPVSAMDIVLQRKHDGRTKTKNNHWRGLSKAWEKKFQARYR